MRLALGIWMSLVIAGAFLYAPPAQGFRSPEAARIVFFHVPTAMVAVIAFVVSVIYAVKFLAGRAAMDDAKSATSAGLGFLFAGLATATGSIFAYTQWGMAWNWDPREISIFVLLLIYAAYFALRSAVEGDERRAALSATYNIVAFIAMPFLVFVMPRVMESLHPSETLVSRAGLSIQYRIVLYSAAVGFVGLYVWIFRLQTAIVEYALNRRQN